eukprot:gene14890-31610_t
MGCCSGCLRPKYRAIPDRDEKNANQIKQFNTEYSGGSNENATSKFDSLSDVFQGCEVLQKFSNSSTYQRRFIWIESSSKTIHMSEHMNKNRRHKEASLANVTSIVSGQPIKSKKKPTQSDENESEDFSTCLTINFKRGGGVDFQFKSIQERDLWHENIAKIVKDSSV